MWKEHPQFIRMLKNPCHSVLWKHDMTTTWHSKPSCKTTIFSNLFHITDRVWTEEGKHGQTITSTLQIHTAQTPELSVQQTPFLARWNEMRSAQPMRCLWWKSIFWSKLLVHVEDRMQNVWPQLFRTSQKLLVNPKMRWAEEHNNSSINLSEMAGLELNVGCLFVDRRVEKDTFRNHHLPHCKIQHHVKACPRNNPTFMYTHHLHQRIEGIQNSSSASMILSKSSPPVQSSMTK